MGLSDILILIGILLLNGGMLLTAWINIKVKLKELDIKYKSMGDLINSNHNQFKEHETWGMAQKELIDTRFDKVDCEIKENQNKLLNKIDLLIQSFADFRVYVEKNLHNRDRN